MKEFLRTKLFIILVGVLVLALLIGGVIAMYVATNNKDVGQIVPEPFYFEVDLLGNSQMQSSDGGAYSFPAVQSGTWHLFGPSAHSVVITVRNYADNTRITQSDIVYTASVTDDITSGDATITSTGGTLTGGSQNYSQITLSIPASTSYSGETVTVTISSSSPYTKQISLVFRLSSTVPALYYRVDDSVNSLYATLYIMSDLLTDATPTLVWPAELQIDNTSEYTFSSGFTQNATDMEARNMALSQAVHPGESIAIRFFKTDVTINYSADLTEVPGPSYTVTLAESSS